MAGLYIHIPFCKSKCAYCDFYSGPLKGFDAEACVRALAEELEARAGEVITDSDSGFSTVYVGGGTPSAIPAGLLSQFCRLAPADAEKTIEANPDDVIPRWADEALAAGFNRVSMGVQSLNDAELREVGRRHSAADAVAAFRTLREAGFNNISLDLIYGLPLQTLDSWTRSVEGVLNLGPEHISAYLLSYEPGTLLYARLQSGKTVEASEDMVESMYATLCRKLAEAGFDHYEISNFGLPGRHAVHNSAYWDFTPYLGLGPGAHSFDGTLRRFNPPDYTSWLKNPAEAFVTEEPESNSLFNDRIVTSLRTAAGLDPSILTPVELSLARKLLTPTPAGNMRIPEEQWLLSNQIMESLIRI